MIKRGIIVLGAIPYCLGMVLLMVFSPITWMLTGKNLEEQAIAYGDFGERIMEWADD